MQPRGIPAGLVVLCLLSIAAGTASQIPQEAPVPPYPYPDAIVEDNTREPDAIEDEESLASDLNISRSQARRALDLTPAVGDLSKTAEQTLPDNYGGVWRDYGEGGRIKLALVAPDRVDVTTLLRGFPAPDFVDVVSVEHTLRDLVALQHRIGEDIPELASRNIKVVTVYAEAQTNRVAVGVARLTASVKSEIESTYGKNWVRVYPESPATAAACSRSNCFDAPARGGLRIAHPTAICSTAFSARFDFTQPDGLLSAGHCADAATLTTHGTPVEYAMGTVAKSMYGQIVLDDGARHGIDANVTEVFDTWLGLTVRKVINKVAYNSPDVAISITAVQRNRTDSPGDPICHSGITRGKRCGSIVATETSVNVDGFVFTDMGLDNVCSLPGDSGGPVFDQNGGEAHGIINFSNYIQNGPSPDCDVTPRTWYTRIHNVEQALYARVYTS